MKEGREGQEDLKESMKDSEKIWLVERSCWPLHRWTSLCDSEVESSRRTPRILEFGGPARKLPLTGPSVDAAYRGLRGDDVKEAQPGIGPDSSPVIAWTRPVRDKLRCKRSDMTTLDRVWSYLPFLGSSLKAGSQGQARYPPETA